MTPTGFTQLSAAICLVADSDQIRSQLNTHTGRTVHCDCFLFCTCFRNILTYLLTYLNEYYREVHSTRSQSTTRGHIMKLYNPNCTVTAGKYFSPFFVVQRVFMQ